MEMDPILWAMSGGIDTYQKLAKNDLNKFPSVIRRVQINYYLMMAAVRKLPMSYGQLGISEIKKRSEILNSER